jgi:hypothetical protein
VGGRLHGRECRVGELRGRGRSRRGESTGDRDRVQKAN